MYRPAERERGAALLTVLMLVAVISVMAAMALEKLRLSTRLAGNAAATEQARSFARAAETLALGRVDDLLNADRTRVTLAGGWSGRPFAVPLPGGGTAVVRVADGGDCFNVNSVVTPVAPGVYASYTPMRLQFARLMRLVGVPAQAAEQIATSTADWIDTDSDQQEMGAEDASYRGGETGYRTAGTLMADPSELRAVAGMTPAIYAQLRPWICALPQAKPAMLNINTLAPEQAPLVAALAQDTMGVDTARNLLLRRPALGYDSNQKFWSAAEQAGAANTGEAAAQTDVTSRWFDLDVDVSVGAARLHQKSLVDATRLPARLVSRQWGGDP